MTNLTSKLIKLFRSGWKPKGMVTVFKILSLNKRQVIPDLSMGNVLKPYNHALKLDHHFYISGPIYLVSHC